MLAACRDADRGGPAQRRGVGLTHMVENRPFRNLLAHAALCIGMFILAFPVYLTFVGSTHPQQVIANGQMPITPGPLFCRDLLEDASSSAPAAPRASRSAPCW